MNKEPISIVEEQAINLSKKTPLEIWGIVKENYLQLKKEKYGEVLFWNTILELVNQKCDIIETALKESKKDDEIKQAFKIFLKKQVEINILFATFNLKNGFYIYNKSAIRKLTQKEYNFLKKVLK